MGVTVKISASASYGGPAGFIDMSLTAKDSVHIYMDNGSATEGRAVGMNIEGWKAIEMGKLLIALGEMAVEE